MCIRDRDKAGDTIADMVQLALAGDFVPFAVNVDAAEANDCLLYTSPSPRDRTRSRMPSSA